MRALTATEEARYAWWDLLRTIAREYGVRPVERWALRRMMKIERGRYE